DGGTCRTSAPTHDRPPRPQGTRSRHGIVEDGREERTGCRPPWTTRHRARVTTMCRTPGLNSPTSVPPRRSALWPTGRPDVNRPIFPARHRFADGPDGEGDQPHGNPSIGQHQPILGQSDNGHDLITRIDDVPDACYWTRVRAALYC